MGETHARTTGAANVDPPGRAWRRAWAIAAAFAEPAAAARALRLDRVVARAEVPTGPVGADAWAALWLASLPEERERGVVADGTTDGVVAARQGGANGVPLVDLAGLDVDGPVRRVLGVHRHGGVRWFRQEGFAAWQAVRAARAWLTGASVADVATLVARLGGAERRSGYDFDRLLAAEPNDDASGDTSDDTSDERS